MERGGGIIMTTSKPLEDSLMTLEESEDLSFQVSQLQYLLKESVRIIDLFNLEERMENSMECRILRWRKGWDI